MLKGRPAHPVLPKPSGEEATSRTGWAMKLWRRGSSQERPLRPASAYSSENSYTEEPSVHPDAESPVYAELAQGLNSYSDIANPAGLFRHHEMTDSEYSYENAGYALSESPADISDKTYHQSAQYYSHVCQDIHVNNVKRKKKMGNACNAEHCRNFSGMYLTRNISSTVPMMPITLGGHSSLNQGIVPLPLRLLPHSLTLERPTNSHSYSPCYACESVKTLPDLKHSCGTSPIVLSSRTLTAIPLMSMNSGQISEQGSANCVQLPGRLQQPPNSGEITPRLTAQSNVSGCGSEVTANLRLYSGRLPIRRDENSTSCPSSEYV